MRKPAYMLAAVMLAALSSASLAADVDWKLVDSHKTTLFYPGVASYEFLTSDDHRLGGRNITAGKKACRKCHLGDSGELDLKADQIAKGDILMKMSQKPLEPEPLVNKKGVMTATVQAAYDAENVYLKIEWTSKGAGWHGGGNTAPDRVSVQINKKNERFAKYGCFIACHSDLNSMPKSPSKQEVLAHPYYSQMKRDDVRLYLSETRGGSWKKLKDNGELSRLKAAGSLMDLWSAELKGGKGTAFDGWVMEDRQWEDQSDVNVAALWSANAGGTYSVVFKRKLKADEHRDVALAHGDVFSMAVSIHDENSSARKHYVSFPVTVGLGANADIKARKLN